MKNRPQKLSDLSKSIDVVVEGPWRSSLACIHALTDHLGLVEHLEQTVVVLTPLNLNAALERVARRHLDRRADVKGLLAPVGCASGVRCCGEPHLHISWVLMRIKERSGSGSGSGSGSELRGLILLDQGGWTDLLRSLEENVKVAAESFDRRTVFRDVHCELLLHRCLELLECQSVEIVAFEAGGGS